MIFQHTVDKVLDGTKTQTRRIVKATHGECYLYDDYTGEPLGILAVGTGKSWLYACGKTYAVQPGRGKHAVGRIRITGLRREDVREISDDDVKAEGFSSYRDFMWTWISMHDKSHAAMIERGELNTDYGVKHRPADRYDAWVIEFELVKENVSNG